jgi:segregation and condensation protein A
MTAEILSFETGRPAELADGEPSLVVDVEGYEGPLDLLLALARQQKVDLAKISILALADQYLQFIEAAAAGARDHRRAERRRDGDRPRQQAAAA